MIPSKKDLAIILSTIEGFEEPVAEWEQYMTPSEIAAELLWIAYMDGNIKGKNVIDLGCGTGIFSFGAALLGAKSVVGYDIDGKAIEIAERNRKIIEGTKIPICEIRFIQKDVKDVNQKCDTVIMNPPFGIQKQGADRVFLEKAFEIAKNVYSIHKFGTEKFIEKFAGEHGFRAIQLTKRTINLKPTMGFHEEFKHPIKVMLWKFTTSK
ncbi:MAG: 50S ribosomal protein L11 methyltransferase [Nanoarchaeota archaeon]|nr:50S ribosomal protein L11 methyltransferase [Nanoarchaeota archaeon]